MAGHESDDRLVAVQLTESSPNKPEANKNGKYQAQREHHDVDDQESTLWVRHARLGCLTNLRRHAETLTHAFGAAMHVEAERDGVVWVATPTALCTPIVPATTSRISADRAFTCIGIRLWWRIGVLASLASRPSAVPLLAFSGWAREG